MKRSKQLLGAVSTIALIAFSASPALAGGSTAGSSITNNVSVSFDVGGVTQTAVTASNTFTVDRKIDVLVRAQEGDRASVESIRRLIVNPGSTRPVTLDAVADVVATTGPSEIHRADQTRVAVVSANLRDIDLGAAMREVQQMVAEQPLGAGVGLHIGGQGEELAQAAKSLIFAFGLAIFLVYLVMVAQFNNFTGCFMSEYHRDLIQAVPLHKVTAADTAGMNFYQAFSFFYFGDRSLFKTNIFIAIIIGNKQNLEGIFVLFKSLIWFFTIHNDRPNSLDHIFWRF